MNENEILLNKVLVGRVNPKIYAFSTNTIPNYLKVGDTYRPVSVRLNEWKEVYPELKKEYETDAVIDDKLFFRDYSVHQFLENDLHKKRINPDDFPNIDYISTEFFKDTKVIDVQKAIDDIIENPNNYKLYDARDLSVYRTVYPRTKDFAPRENQQLVIDNFKRVYKTRKNLLMYAVMRFGKSFTAMCCAREMNAKVVLIVSAKADVSDEWQKTVQEHKYFENFEFIDKNILKLSNTEIKRRLEQNKSVALFLTLQDLQIEKEIHKELFENTIDLMIIDESHFGARASKYGKIIKDAKSIDESNDEKDDEIISFEKADNQIRNIERILKIDVKLHLSGTPYRILLSDEFEKEDIIARVQFSDIIEAQHEWDKKYLNEEKYDEWDNPYYGFPQMVRFAFTPSKNAQKVLADLEAKGISSGLSELLRPCSTIKINDDYKKFIHENEVFELLSAIDGSSEDENILSFLNYKKIKEGKMCHHIVMVLPFKASCDAMEHLILNNKDKFINLNKYEILNISGLDSRKKYKNTEIIKNKIEQFEKNNKMTITLTVNRMLTGSTVKEWDTMIFLKGTSSPQEYDQAVFRLQNQFIKDYIIDTDEDTTETKIIKYNMKPQTLLIDFDPNRMFILEEEKAFVSNSSDELTGNDLLKSKLTKELSISPIIVMNKNKIHEVDALEIMNLIRDYSKDKGVMDEVYNIPSDFRLLQIDTIKDMIAKQGEIGSKNPFQTRYEFDGEGEDYDTGDEILEPGETQQKEKQNKNITDEKANLEKIIDLKFKTYYMRILFYAALTKTKVDNIRDIIDSINNEENIRIFNNLDLDHEILEIFIKHMNPDILKKLEYKISSINELSNDKTLTKLERAIVALNKFDRISDAEVMTQQSVCNDMLNTIGKQAIIKTIKSGGKILDIASKKAEFTIAIVNMLIENGVNKDDYCNLLYSIPTSKIAYEFTRKIYEILDLNVDNIAENITSYDLLQVRDGNNIKYDAICNYLTRNVKFKDISMEENIFNSKGDGNVKFDIIVGNPPYQEDDGGAGASARPIYNHFVNISKKLEPNYLSLIIPSRWYVGGKGLDDFRKCMVNDSEIKEIHDCLTPDDIFPNTNNRGGVCYLLWDRSYNNQENLVKVVSHSNNKIINSSIRPLKLIDDDIFIRDSKSKTILDKVTNYDFDSFENIVSSRKPFGLDGNYAKKHKDSINETSTNTLKCYIKGKNEIFVNPNDVQSHQEWVNNWKVFIPRANNIGTELNDDNLNSFVGEPKTICSESYIVVGADLLLDKVGANNLSKYLQTKFLRYLHMLLKSSQDATSKTFSFVPIQNFGNDSDIDWNKSIDEIDEQLFKKYKLSKDEVEHIDKSIKKM
ncbi:MAG: Eco57I restriction-modification methylase domain-containing protein [Bacilli bacterium]|nr:Eco57I restriction-modification methylase domain-containing protein [Bacilli bacterium]